MLKPVPSRVPEVHRPDRSRQVPSCRYFRILALQMHEIIKAHDLKGCMRWLVAQKQPRKNGELYRIIAGRACVFILFISCSVQTDRKESLAKGSKTVEYVQTLEAPLCSQVQLQSSL